MSEENKKETSSPLILSVDDEEIHNRILKRVLERLGTIPILTTSSEEFLEKLKTIHPSACLIDINIKKLGDGFQLVETLRRDLPARIPIIVVSQESEYQAIAHALELGADDYISKPVDLELLAWKLKRFLDTEGLVVSASGDVTIPKETAEGTVELEAYLVEINEFGMTFESQHLPSKGIQITLGGGLIETILASNSPLSLRVESTWLAKDGKSYGFFAEFENTESDSVSAVRRWLTLIAPMPIKRTS